MHRTRPARAFAWRELGRIWLLALLLLLAQQGALLHELSHYAQAEAAGQNDKQHPGGEVCGLCIAFSQVGASPAPGLVVPALLSDLSFAPPAGAFAALFARDLPALRNRGPPADL